jgi:UDP-N-acetylmuramyl pentapeptide synthase
MGLAPDALVTYETNDDAIAWLREHVRPDDLVLLKGSRMYRMEQIVAGLTA